MTTIVGANISFPNNSPALATAPSGMLPVQVSGFYFQPPGYSTTWYGSGPTATNPYPNPGLSTPSQINAPNFVATSSSDVNSFAGNVGIGTTSPGVALDVKGAIRPGSSATVTACGSGAANGEGSTRYNYTSHFMEFCNGTTWVQMQTYQAGGATTPVVSSGPPVSANTYTYTASANFTPGYGAVANIKSGTWPANGTSTARNAACVQLINQSQATPSNTITLDLGSIKAINNLYVSMEHHSEIMTLGVTFSTDGVAYTSSTSIYFDINVSQITSYVANTLSSTVNARYIKLTNGGSILGYTDQMALCQFAVGP